MFTWLIWDFLTFTGCLKNVKNYVQDLEGLMSDTIRLFSEQKLLTL